MKGRSRSKKKAKRQRVEQLFIDEMTHIDPMKEKLMEYEVQEMVEEEEVEEKVQEE